MSLIIIEGCDKTGKTSMAQALSRRTGLPVRKFSQPRDKNMTEYFEAVASGSHFIADRFHLGELVYAPLYRGYTPSLYQFQELEDKLIARCALLVLMYDYESAVIERFRALKEDFALESDVRRILTDFRHAYEDSRLMRVRLMWGATPAENEAAVNRVLSLAGWVSV